PTIDVQPPPNEAPRSSGGTVLGPSALPSTSTLPVQTITKPRRHKVVVPSAPSFHDPAFPVQIQEELLNQVRYWTSQAEMKEKLNQEYDLKITEQERIIDALNKQRRIREENDERQKEDQWNLELLNQELRSQNQELQGQLSKALHENTKIQRSLVTVSEQVEQLKDKEEKAAGQLELTKSRYEQDMTTMRKHNATIQREKSDLMKKMDDMSATLTMQQQKLAKKATLEAIAQAQERELEEMEKEEMTIQPPILIQAPPRILSNDDLAPPATLSVSPSEPKMASLARETSFAHQQSIISELQAKLSKEVTEKENLVSLKEQLLSEKEELVKMLADREETIEAMRMEGAIPNIMETVPLPMSTKSTLDTEKTRHSEELDEQEVVGLDDHDYSHSLNHGLGAELSRRCSNASFDAPAVSGGLFAELAQARSTIPPVAIEYKDQEVMTEPLEAWIHTLPGFTAAAVAETSPASTETTAAAATEQLTETKDSSAELESAIPVEIIAPKSTDNSTSTDVQLVPSQAIVTTDNSTSTADLVEKAELASRTAIEAEIEAAAKAAVAEAITEAVAEAVAKTKAEMATNAATAAAVTAAAAANPSPIPEPVKATPVVLVDSSTSTMNSSFSKDASTATEQVPARAISTSRPASIIKEKAPGAPTRNGHLADIITGTQNAPFKSIVPSQESASINTPTVVGLDVASVHLPEPLVEAHNVHSKTFEPSPLEPILPVGSGKSLQMVDDKPTPRATSSDIPADDERRHTCDMSQSVQMESNDAKNFMNNSAIPPVPAIPQDYYTAATVSRRGNPTPSNGPESRDSYGSAFGDAKVSDGRVKSVYSNTAADNIPQIRTVNSDHDGNFHDERQTNDQDSSSTSQGATSPGRPATGPPSSLLARAAARASMGSELADVVGEHTFTSGQAGFHHPYHSNESTSAHGPPTNGSAHQEQLLSSSSPPRGSSVSSALHAPAAQGYMMPTGAAVISSTTRTAYTFNQSSSQIHVPSSSNTHYQHITDSSGASIARSHRYRHSPNGSISSMSTDYGGGRDRDRRMSVSSNYDGQGTMATDPTMIQVITQTMIGDYLWKYTRRPTVMASVISEKRHRRYFWVHPYTKTMYWSLNNPAAEGSREQRAKSALIVAVFQITDDNISSTNSDLPNVSLLVQTSSRNLKLTAPTREKHDLWYQSLAYLLSRPSTPSEGTTDMPSDNQTWSEVQASRGVASDTLLTIRNEKSVRKKSSFNRLHNIFGRSKDVSPAGSPRGGASTLGSGVSSTSVGERGGQQQHSTLSSGMVMAHPYPHSQDAHFSTSHSNESGNPSVIGYPSHMAQQGTHVVGGYGTVNGGPILSSSSPQSRLHGYSPSTMVGDGVVDVDGDEDIDDDDDDDDDEDGVLPEHIRQCCDGKHDIGSLDHRH
ncbi:hypothetical protein BGZ94_010261, partial [Podila epigama]